MDRVSLVASRERFLEFNWLYAVGLVAYAVAAWIAEGPWLVLGSLGLALLIGGVWYVIWRRSGSR